MLTTTMTHQHRYSCCFLWTALLLVASGKDLAWAQQQPQPYARPFSSTRHGTSNTNNNQNNRHSSSAGSFQEQVEEQEASWLLSDTIFESQEGATTTTQGKRQPITGDHYEHDPIWKELWKNDKKDILAAFRVLAPNPKPRGVFHAIYKASKSTALGFLVGMLLLVSSLPMTLLSLILVGWHSASWAAASACLLGGAASVCLGIGNGLVQFGWGLWQWPRSLETWWSDDCVWNPNTGDYMSFDLDEYKQELDLQADKRRQQTIDEMMPDSNYYKLLGVSTSCSKSELRRAYRQKALKQHPDKILAKTKNLSDGAKQEASQKFDRLQKAYQILSNDSLRAIYDEWGADVVDDLPPFDPSLFATMLFQSRALEPYIGQLSVTSFGEQLFYLLLFAKQQENKKHFEDDEEGVERHVDTIRKAIKLVASWNLRAERRETDVALHLQNCIEPYVSGSMSEEAYLEWCTVEARRLYAESDPALLAALAEALVGTSKQFFGFHWLAPWSYPWGVISWVRNNIAQARHWARVGSKLWSLGAHVLSMTMRSLQQEAAPEVGEDSGLYHHAAKEEDREFKILVAHLVSLMDSYNNVHIWKVVKGVSWKLYRDSNVSRRTRFDRARALRVLGEQLGRLLSDCGYHQSLRNGHHDVLRKVEDRVDEAWQTCSS